MRFMCDEMYNGLLHGKEYYTSCKDLPDTDVCVSIRDSELRFTLNPPMEYPLCEATNISWLMADWKEVKEYPLTFLEALNEMQKNLDIKCTYYRAEGTYSISKEGRLLFHEYALKYPDLSEDSFNFLSRFGWEIVKNRDKKEE